MHGIDLLIEHENEGTALDFKATQYLKPNYEALLKDLMAMANAPTSGDRYIIIGVRMNADGSRDFIGVEPEEFVDSATYHQLVAENIEPELAFDYIPYTFKGVKLGLLRIRDPDDAPYMMRKAYGQGLRHGDAFIRLGSHQRRLTRPDLDRIFQRRILQQASVNVQVAFDGSDNPSLLRIPASSLAELPSQRAKRKILAILAGRERAQQNPGIGLHSMAWGLGSIGFPGPTPYEGRSTEQLRKDLEKVEESYHEHDLYASFEQFAQKLNFVLLNNGTQYVEDASIRVLIQKEAGLAVASMIHREPPSAFSPLYMPVLFERYPKVESTETHYVVTADVGDLRHGIPSLAFEEPLRLVLGSKLVGQSIDIQVTVFGKQLPQPRNESLRLSITPPREANPAQTDES
ncbi:MAG TPA: ATP-binding protein [Longimicrobium sp.]|jgi:hypothetical protein|uniref:ATP-binding protein n=1 Tax=Longimicrobium sp. TaxID=2029185 RepID=UPI002EDB645F